MTWPNFLVEELADRRCVVVIGAGVSNSCETPEGNRPPAWPELLTALLDLVTDSATRTEVQQLLQTEKYLAAAQVLTSTAEKEDRERLLKHLLDQSYEPSEWTRIVRDLDQNVYVTTNYDCIFEDACPKKGFRTHIHNDREAVKVLRSPERLILKVHGCIRRDSGSLVFAMSDYHDMRALRPHCLQLLEAIFATHTALFVGYSMSDPDLQLVLQNVNISFPYAQPHILFAPESMHPAVQAAMEASLNLRFVSYPKGSHAIGLERFRQLASDVESMRASRMSSSML